ncbi:MAG: ribonuclease P protein component [Lachnospiraceae bacterium]|nr:ribonuclease P protein component [Lachnospiraceae bacterium]
MKYSESLKKNRDFLTVYRKGASFANKYLVMYVRENGLNKNRLGISVSKKVGNSVVRHHLCRLVREGYRLQEELFHRGVDIVVVARVNAKDCTYFEIERAIYHLGKLHHIVEVEKKEKANEADHDCND